MLWQQLPARRQPPFVYVVRFTRSAAGDNERWWVASFDTWHWKKETPCRAHCILLYLGFLCCRKVCSCFVFFLSFFLTLTCKSSVWNKNSTDWAKFKWGHYFFHYCGELRCYICPEVLEQPGATCNQVLRLHTFPFFSCPSYLSSDFRVEFGNQKKKIYID